MEKAVGGDGPQDIGKERINERNRERWEEWTRWRGREEEGTGKHQWALDVDS